MSYKLRFDRFQDYNELKSLDLSIRAVRRAQYKTFKIVLKPSKFG